MAGIVSYGVHIPYYRLERQEISRAWGIPPQRGERAVANLDEDAITMGVAAAINCTKGISHDKVDGLYFASASSPYLEKLAAATIATAIDLGDETSVADFAHSLRAGTSALEAALDAVKAKSARQVMLVCSECRLATPGSELEMYFGDGAVSLLIGDSDVAVEIEGTYGLYDDILDLWRRDGDRFVKTWERRFALQEGYMKDMTAVISGILKKCSLKPNDFDRVILYAPDERSHRNLSRKMGFDPNQIQDALFSNVANTGAAHALMMLVAALEEAKAGERLLLANYGDGASAYVLRVKDQINAVNNALERRGVKGNLKRNKIMLSYETYLSFRNLIPLEASHRPQFTMSAPRLWRDKNGAIRFYGTKCNNCGTIHYPPSRICTNCQSKDNYEKVRLADKEAKLYSFSVDHLAERPTVNAAIDFDGGGRMFALLTDCEPDQVKAGTRLEMTLRLSYQGMPQGREFWNYFWKARPID